MLKEDIDLVCTGVPFNTKEKNLIKKLNIEKRIHQQFASNEQLNQLMFQAEAFIYPSVAEGFGMPILEAYRCSCPCIISDIPCFHEVAGDVAEYFDPSDSEAIATAISSTITDSSLLNNLRNLGRQRMKGFSWERTASETLKVYKRLTL